MIGEIAGNPRALDFTASRRLTLAAEQHGVPLWLVRLDAARDLVSARMRWEVRRGAFAAPALERRRARRAGVAGRTVPRPRASPRGDMDPAAIEPDIRDLAAEPVARPPMPRRILSIWLSRLAIDRWRLGERLPAAGADGGADADPARADRRDRARSADRPPSTPRGSPPARAAGMMLADARALCPQIQVAPSDPAGDLAFLERLALWAQRWGPWSAIDRARRAAGRCHRGGAPVRRRGRGCWPMRARAFAGRGLAARLAIAPTAGAAWALAHHGPGAAILPAHEDIAAALADLPVAALRLDADVLRCCAASGSSGIGDLAGRFEDRAGATRSTAGSATASRPAPTR